MPTTESARHEGPSPCSDRPSATPALQSMRRGREKSTPATRSGAGREGSTEAFLDPSLVVILVHRFIQLMQLDVPSALSRRRPGSTFAVGTGFRRCSGFDMSDGASLPDESCE